MTRLKRCPGRNCNELIPLDAVTCGKHLCRICGEREPSTVSGRLCAVCRNARSSEIGKKAAATRRNMEAAPVVDANAEQRAFDKDLNARLSARCGYGHSPVRKLSKKEIAAYQANL